MAKHPDERFQTAVELADVLEVRHDVPVPLPALVRRLRYTSGLSLLDVIASLLLITALVSGELAEIAKRPPHRGGHRQRRRAAAATAAGRGATTARGAA